MPRASRSRLQLSEEDKKKRRREQKKNSIRRVRAKMSQEAIEERRRKDRERYQKKKEEGLIKTIKDYTPRQQRQMRKIWREKAKKKREIEKVKKNAQALLDDNTPPSSPSCSRVSLGRAVAARNRHRINAENMYLKSRLRSLENKLAKNRMRYLRLNKKFQKMTKRPVQTNKKPKNNVETKKAVHEFLLQDEHSRLTSGKKETITRRKIKKQIRLLNDSLLNLHKIFVNKTDMNISYETFRRYRPFWVLIPKVASRNTCLCVTHTNINYVVEALQKTKIINFRSATDAIKSICCYHNDSLDITCLERRCPNCKNKKINCNEYNPGDSISYERWVTKSVLVIIKGQEKTCKKTVKETVHTTKRAVTELLDSKLPEFLQHVANNINQLQVVRNIKQQISPSEGLLHIDFSENYNCKYGQEIQSAHFGGSKPQLSLHTCVYYSTQTEPPENFIQATSICTISENLRHDPVFICAHLKPVMKRIKELSPKLKHLHVLSDGPSTQYRNKTMFHLIATYLSKEFDVDTIEWHYSEKGHGKGAPDGVGGCIKRVCDNSVAKGNDVSSYDTLMSCVKENCQGIEVYGVDESVVPKIQNIVDGSETKPFKGTFKIHQLTWSVTDPATIHARRLSCLICAAHAYCRHFEIGQIKVQFKIPDSPTISIESRRQSETLDTPSARNSPELEVLQDIAVYDSPGNPPTPDTPSARNSPELEILQNLAVMNSPGNPATPDAPTEPNTPSPPETPAVLTESHSQNRRPLKRRRIHLSSGDSDRSDDIQVNKKKSRFPTIMYSDDENIF